MPAVNTALLLAVVAAVVGFRSSTALGAAYGIAVTVTMLITTFSTYYVLRFAWKFSFLPALLATGFFFLIDLTFFAANLLKIVEGGWFPLVIGAVVFTGMGTWARGRDLSARFRTAPHRHGHKPGQQSDVGRWLSEMQGGVTPTPETGGPVSLWSTGDALRRSADMDLQKGQDFCIGERCVGSRSEEQIEGTCLAQLTPMRACFGVCCLLHDRCARYAAVSDSQANPRTMGTCATGHNHPLFVELQRSRRTGQ